MGRGDGMSVLVKGMKMPRNCYECKVWSQCFDEKPPFNMIKSVCPLVEVKEPHGRLIDIDDAIESYGERAELGYVSQSKFLNVVIQAEGSEE